MADWQVGDIAFCWREIPIYTPDGEEFWCPEPGQFLTVVEVGALERGGIYLDFLEDPDRNDNCGFDAFDFRKVTPEAEDAFDREVIAHMAGQEVEDA